MAKYLDSTGLTYLWGKITAAFQAKVTASGLLKGDGSGGVTAATSGTDYQAPLPSQSGNNGKYLTTNGSALSWGSVTIPTGSSTSPAMDGTAAAGTETTWAHGDHVHPTDTSRQAKITASGILKGDGSGGVSAATAGTDYVASPEMFTVTVTKTSDPQGGGGYIYSGDKTFAEITAANTAGKLVRAKINDGASYYNLVFINNLRAKFQSLSEGETVEYITCNSSNAWSGDYTVIQRQITTAGILQGDGFGSITAYPLTHNTSTSTSLTANTNLITASTLRYHTNRTTSVAAADTNYSTVMARGIYAGTSSMTAGSTSLTNGVIYLQYDA